MDMKKVFVLFFVVVFFATLSCASVTEPDEEAFLEKVQGKSFETVYTSDSTVSGGEFIFSKDGRSINHIDSIVDVVHELVKVIDENNAEYQAAGNSFSTTSVSIEGDVIKFLYLGANSLEAIFY